MKKLLLVILVWAFSQTYSWSQEAISSINLDLIQNKLNGGLPLPSEEKFYVQGAIPSSIELVKIEIYPSKKSKKSGYTYFWKTPFGYNELAFRVLIEDPLRSNDDYHVEIGFYQKAGVDEVRELRELIHTNLSTYLTTITSVKKGGIHMEDSDEQIISNLSKIVTRGAYYFEMPTAVPFPGFSDLTLKKLEQRKKLKMGKAKYNVAGLGDGDNARGAYARQYLDELEAIIFAEVDQYFSTNLLARVDEKKFQNYPTEKKANSIPINVGYGALSLSKNLPQQEFVHSPYVGVSFPLGNRTFARFMSNMSLSTGLFVSGNMENSLGEKISGPALDRPVYIGLGYSFFRFIRLNAGGTFITTEQLDGTMNNGFQPFIGVSAEFRIWLGIGNKK